MTVQTDDSGNKNIIIGPQADADGWIDAHLVLEECSVVISYNDGRVDHSLSPVSFEEIDWSRMDESQDSVWVGLTLSAKSNAGLVSTFANAHMLIYRDGHIEDPDGMNNFLANISAPCKIKTGSADNKIGTSVKH